MKWLVAHLDHNKNSYAIALKRFSESNKKFINLVNLKYSDWDKITLSEFYN